MSFSQKHLPLVRPAPGMRSEKTNSGADSVLCAKIAICLKTVRIWRTVEGARLLPAFPSLCSNLSVKAFMSSWLISCHVSFPNSGIIYRLTIPVYSRKVETDISLPVFCNQFSAVFSIVFFIILFSLFSFDLTTCRRVFRFWHHILHVRKSSIISWSGTAYLLNLLKRISCI
jgi:hypothetical protein